MDSKSPKIGLVVASCAPIPDVLGGGAERLITLLADENEKYHRAELYIYSIINKRAIEKSKNYKYTKFFYFNYGSLFDRSYNALLKIMNRIGLCTNSLYRGYFNNILKLTKQHNLDLIIDENSYVKEIKYFTDYYGRTKISTHIHCAVNPKQRGIDDLYGSIIGVSQFTVNNWIGNSDYKNIIEKTVYSGIDEEVFRKSLGQSEKIELRKKYGIDENDFVVIYCGRINKDKGVDKLVEAIKYINKPDIKFLIVGGENLKSEKAGKFQNSVRAMAYQYGKRVIFTGYISNKELYKYYSIADIQVIPSMVQEAAGLISIEGMYAGLPIIATNAGGLTEYVNPDCAIILEQDDKIVKNIATSINELYRNNNLREKMSECSKKRSLQFTKKSYYDHFIDAVTEIISKGQ